MSWKRESEWEERPHVIEAYWSTDHYGVYYVTKPDEESHLNTGEEGDIFYLQYWPDKRKSMETVSLLDSYESEDAALNALHEKIEE